MSDEVLILKADLEQLITKELDKIQTALVKTDTKSKSTFDKMAQNVLKTTTQFIGMAGAVVLVQKSITYIIKTTAVYEASLSRLKAIVQPTQQQFDALSKKARELGASTKFTATESAKAFTALGQLGLSTNQILASSQGVLNLAAAAQIDMASAAEMTASTLAQFKMDAGEANRVVDVMAKSFNISALNAQRLQDSMKFAGVAAGNFGIGVEETTAALAALSKQNIVGTIAGTGMKNIMSQLYQENSKVGKAIGVTANDTRSFTERLEAVRAKGFTAGQMMEMFGLEAGNVGIALVNNLDSMKKFNVELEGAAGTSQKMADIMQDNLIGSFTKFKSAIENAAISIGEYWTPALKTLIDGLTDVVNGIFGVEMSIKGSAFVDAILEKEAAVNELNKEIKILDAMEEQAQKRGAEAEANRIRQIDERTSKIQLLEKEINNLRKAEANRLKLSGGRVSVEDTGGAVKTTGGGEDTSTTPTGSSLPDAKALAKQAKKLADIEQKRQDKIKAFLQEEVDNKLSYEEKMKSAREKFKEATIQSETDEYAKSLELLKLKHEKELEEVKGNLDAKKILQQAHEQEIKNLQKSEADKRNKLVFDSSIKVAEAANDAIGGIIMQRIDKEKQMEIENVKANIKNKEEQEKLIKKIEKDAFKREKRAKILQAIINTALAVTSTIASTPGGPIIKAIAGATVGALGAIQIATIAAQKFSQGGIVAGNKLTGDNVPALVNSQEMILNKSQQSNLFNLLNNGGVPVTSTTRTINEQPLQISFQVNGNLDQAAADRVIDKVDRLRTMAEDLREAKKLGLLDRMLV